MELTRQRRIKFILSLRSRSLQGCSNPTLPSSSYGVSFKQSLYGLSNKMETLRPRGQYSPVGDSEDRCTRPRIQCVQFHPTSQICQNSNPKSLQSTRLCLFLLQSQGCPIKLDPQEYLLRLGRCSVSPSRGSWWPLTCYATTYNRVCWCHLFMTHWTWC